LSSDRSATIFLSLPFSSSSWRNRFISEGILRRSACPLASTLSQLQPVLGQTKPKRAIFGVLSQSSQPAAFPRLFAKEAKQIGVAPSCWPTFLGMGYLTAPAFEGVQVGQSPKPWRSAHKAHRLSATWATWRNRPSIVGTICRHVDNFVLCTAHCRGDELAGEVHAAHQGLRRIRADGDGHAPVPRSPHLLSSWRQRHP